MIRFTLLFIMLFLSGCGLYVYHSNDTIANKEDYYRLHFVRFIQNLGKGEYLATVWYCPVSIMICEEYELQYKMVHIYNYPQDDIVDNTKFTNLNKVFYYSDIYKYTNVKGSVSTVPSLGYTKKKM